MAGDRHEEEQQQQHFRDLSPENRAILWEVNIARNCVESFSKLIDAQAIVMSLLVTVNLIGFLQPPKGWQVLAPGGPGPTDPDTEAFIRHNECTAEEPCVFMYSSRSMDAFAALNSLSLYSAVSGLLLYVYCSYSTIMTFGSVPLPDRFDRVGLMVLGNLRAALRRVALPSLRRRSILLFSLLLASLVFCMAAYISAGVAAIRPGHRLKFVILPSLPGCLIVLVLLIAAISKIRMELDFKTRFGTLSRMLKDPKATYPPMKMPALVRLDEELVNALDPVPSFVKWAMKKCGIPTGFDDDDDDDGAGGGGGGGGGSQNQSYPNDQSDSVPLHPGPTSSAYSSPAHPAFHVVQGPHHPNHNFPPHAFHSHHGGQQPFHPFP